MLDIIITHYREPWEVCKKQFWMLEMQRRVDWKEIRVTVVNDGGCRLPEEELNRLSFSIEQLDIPHGGISAARNAGIEHATEPWIMFCDCDDCFSNIYALEDIVNVIRGQAAEKYDMMWSTCYEENESSGIIFLIPKQRVFVFTHGKIYRRQYLMEQGIRFDTALKMNEDSCFNATIIARTHRVGEIRSHVPPYAWIRRENSLTGQEGADDLGAYCQMHRNMVVTEENRKYRPEEYPGMVTRTAYDAYFMVHGNRITASCKQKILGEFVPWLRERLETFGTVSEGMLDDIREISRSELLDHGPDDGVICEHSAVRAWVEWIAEERSAEDGMGKDRAGGAVPAVGAENSVIEP